MNKSILKFNREIYVKPFSSGEVMYFETVLPLENEEISLLYPIEEVYFLTDYELKTIYEEGKDFFVKDGKIIIPKTSKIKTFPLDEYYPKEPGGFPNKVIPELCPYKFNELRYICFGESDYMSTKQIAVTYRHKNTHLLYEQKVQVDKLPNFFKKINKDHKATVLFYGDSITVGCNSSGTEYGNNSSPYAESWPIMVKEIMASRLNAEINYINTAVGGTTTKWGEENYEERVNKYHPDLLILAFGMNDPWSKEEHMVSIRNIINGVRKANPNCDIILVSTSVPNVESEMTKFHMQTFYQEYDKIDIKRVAHVNMTLAHLDLLKYKKFKDMSGNNVNHPNDFLVRLYAQSILKVLGL